MVRNGIAYEALARSDTCKYLNKNNFVGLSYKLCSFLLINLSARCLSMPAGQMRHVHGALVHALGACVYIYIYSVIKFIAC